MKNHGPPLLRNSIANTDYKPPPDMHSQHPEQSGRLQHGHTYRPKQKAFHAQRQEAVIPYSNNFIPNRQPIVQVSRPTITKPAYLLTTSQPSVAKPTSSQPSGSSMEHRSRNPNQRAQICPPIQEVDDNADTPI